MEDVLATYEKPYAPAEPVAYLDEKPVSLHADIRPPIPAAPGSDGKTGQRVQTMRHRQCLLRRGAESRSAFHPAHPQPLRARICPGAGDGCEQLSRGAKDSPGDG